MLVDYEWIREHQHDLDGWVPRIEILRPGSRHTFTIKSKDAMKEVVKVMRENRKKGG